MPKCKHCKALIDRDEKYCSECGEKVKRSYWYVYPIIVIIVVFFVLSSFSFIQFKESSLKRAPLEVKESVPSQIKEREVVPAKQVKEEVPTKPEEPEIPPGSIAIFYRTSLSEVSHRLPVSVQYNTIEGGGYATNIRWESTNKGVVRYIPVINRFDVMGTTRSTSYSKSSISPFTINGRVFTVTKRSTATSINELDPKTAKIKRSVPVGPGDFAIVGDKIFYRKKISTNIYGDRSAGGQLMVRSLKGGIAKEVLAYGDKDNSGRFYGGGNALFSVLYDFKTKTDTIRLHDTNTGKISRVVYNDLPAGRYIQGDDALYQVVNVDKTYWVSMYPPQGESKVLAEIELDPGEKGLSIDQERGKLLIFTYGDNFKVKSVLMYDIDTGVTEEVSIETFGSSSGQDYQFVFLD